MPRLRPLAAALVTAGVLAPQLNAQSPPRLTAELEGGLTWQSYNNVQIPNDETGTRFSLSDLIGSGPWASARLYLTWQPSPKHGVRLLVAPLTVTGTGIPTTSLRFAGASYQTGQPLSGTYTFNSYRLTYRYRVHDNRRTTAWIGFTAKIRDASIALEQNGTTSRKDDLGFVPLLHLSGQWRFAEQWELSLDADALAGGPGRAEDVAVKVGRALGRGWVVRAGYRMVEGGADVESVYTFAWLHSAVLSIQRSF